MFLYFQIPSRSSTTKFNSSQQQLIQKIKIWMKALFQKVLNVKKLISNQNRKKREWQIESWWNRQGNIFYSFLLYWSYWKMLFSHCWTAWFYFPHRKTHFPGNYIIEMDILVPYATNRKTGFYVDVPKVTKVLYSLLTLGRRPLIKWASRQPPK